MTKLPFGYVVVPDWLGWAIESIGSVGQLNRCCSVRCAARLATTRRHPPASRGRAAASLSFRSLGHRREARRAPPSIPFGSPPLIPFGTPRQDALRHLRPPPIASVGLPAHRPHPRPPPPQEGIKLRRSRPAEWNLIQLIHLDGMIQRLPWGAIPMLHCCWLRLLHLSHKLIGIP
uniref:Uncharacterized protein n=1 Tax=Setaria viridis TaxID=4556 RepID=A0A4V6D5J1_SETVI|nr:hypothetical protein SEVIR_6G181300v2 [Setaria viridis]